MEPRQSVQGPRKFAQPGLGSERLTVTPGMLCRWPTAPTSWCQIEGVVLRGTRRRFRVLKTAWPSLRSPGQMASKVSPVL